MEANATPTGTPPPEGKKNAAKKKTRKKVAGLGSVYQKGPWWYLKFRQGGRQTYLKFPTEELAERARLKVAHDRAEGNAGLERSTKDAPTLEVLAQDWIKRRETTHRCAQENRAMWKCYLAKPFGGYRPVEVTSDMVARFIDKMRGEGYAPNTVGNTVRLLSSLYTELRERKLARTNPCAELTRQTRKKFAPPPPRTEGCSYAG